MANKTIKVPGYVKKTVYNGNIEYRNYSPDLVGLQLTSEGGTPLFTMGNFNITTNLEPKSDKLFITKQFSEFVTLDGLNLTVSQSETLLNNNAIVFLNIDKSKLSYYATFGSLTEFIRVGLENIIMTWPASIFMRPIKGLSNGEQIIGNTYEDYSYNSLTNTSTFKVPTNFINNLYNINYLTNGDISGTFNESNTLRNMVTNYDSYALLIDNVEYDVIEFTGSTDTVNEFIYFKIKDNPFTATSDNISYHIKPKAIVCDDFFNGLDEFEYYLLNRQSYPAYTATFKYPLRTDFGVLLFTETTITWPTSDGYNLDYSTSTYEDYATTLFNLANDSDLINSNIMTRFLVSEAITGFDTLPYYLSDEDQDTSGGKVNKLLNIYGTSYDQINRYIEGLSFANTVTYDKLDNTPDVYLKNIARVMGWELVESVISNNLLTDYIQTTKSSFSGQSQSLTPVEADIELWRRIILNTPWLWKSKGTRKGIEFLLRFIGTPNGLITFNEYVYKVDKPIDVNLFTTLLELNGLDTDIANYPIDNDGYPRFFDDTDDMYFQGNGLWYRETSGPKSTLDITSGNNPHVGPYDGGFKYFNQLRSLIPDFTPVTITSSTVTTITQDLFTNYNTGEITDYNGDTYVDLTDDNGLDLSGLYINKVEIINDPKPTIVETNCGCPVDSNDESLSICLEKKDIVVVEKECSFVSKEVLNSGFYVFTAYSTDNLGNNTTSTYETFFTSKKCCTGSQLNGVSMYNDINPPPGYIINSGYMCCKAQINCACNIAKDWIISKTTYQLNGDNYLIFNTFKGDGTSVVVGADVSLCPLNDWTTAVGNIIDPYTGLSGFGCKLTSLGFAKLTNLYDQYVSKANSNLGCDFVFTQPTIIVIPPAPPASGTVLSQSCDGTTRVIVTADGNGGSTITRTENSVSCGYRPPLPTIVCSGTGVAGVSGISDSKIQLDSTGGTITILFFAGTVRDKLEIYHGYPQNSGVNKKATTGSITGNSGPFDNTYGTPPTNAPVNEVQANATPQFIGTGFPQRRNEYSADTGNIITTMNYPNPQSSGNPYEQVVWWNYTASDYLANQFVTIRVTGQYPGTGWAFYRWCP
jgi:hypothetical protein